MTRKILLLVIGIQLSAFGFASAEAGRTAAPFLTRSISARASAMGGAFTAVSGGLDSIWYNPAGVSGMSRPMFNTTLATGLDDDTLGAFAYGHPTRWGTLTVGALYLDGGTINLDLTSGLKETRKAEQDVDAFASYSVEVSSGLRVGGTFKWLESRLAERYTAHGQAFDAGVIWTTPYPGIDLGAAVQNIGSDLKFDQKGDPLPRATRAGAVWKKGFEDEEGTGYAVLVAGDYYSELYKDGEARLGVETTRLPTRETPAAATLRLGYRFQKDIDSAFSFGVGFGWPHFILDYSYSLAKELRSSHRLSLSWRF